MAAATLVARLRRRMADGGNPPAFSDAEFSILLDEHGGREPHARRAALLELATEAGKRTDYSVGVSSEKVSQAFDHLFKLVEEAKAEVAALDQEAAAQTLALAQSSVAVPVQVWF